MFVRRRRQSIPALPVAAASGNSITASAPGGQRHARAAVFVSDGRKTALHEIAAHHDKDGVSAGKAARFVHMILMAAVEWVIFCNKAGYFQGKAPF